MTHTARYTRNARYNRPKAAGPQLEAGGVSHRWDGWSVIIPPRSGETICLARNSCRMKSLTDTLLTIAVLGGILVLSALFTNWFTRKMYFTCSQCRALNAKRRTHCRICSNQLTVNKERPSEKAE